MRGFIDMILHSWQWLMISFFNSNMQSDEKKSGINIKGVTLNGPGRYKICLQVYKYYNILESAPIFGTLSALNKKLLTQLIL